MKKTAIVTLILIILAVVCVQPINAQHQGNITIHADGSISPSTAPLRRTSSVYSLINDVVGSMTVYASNIILDGSGHTVSSVSLYGASNVTVKRFVVTLQNEFTETIGVSLNNASNNLLVNNTVTGFWSIQALNGILFAGIHVIGGNSNTITQNNLKDNLDGLSLADTSYNLIAENNVASSPVRSPYTTLISFSDSSNNTIYHNNFVDSKFQAASFNSANVWDDGYPNGGNYWGDYKTRYPNASMIDNSGVGNTPYFVGTQNKDRYPLMQPFNSTDYAIKTIPSKIAVISPTNKVYNESGVPLLFTTDKPLNWIGYSLDGKENITLPGNSTIANLTEGLHTVTIYGNGTYGTIGVSEIINFTIAIPDVFPTVAVAAASAAIVITVICLAVYLKKRCL